jgi:hypothetical protein
LALCYYAGTTPERAEYEASIHLSSEEGGGGGCGLNVIDEDEWTDLNFGNNSTNCANTSDDSVSDLDSDQGEDGNILLDGLFPTCFTPFSVRADVAGTLSTYAAMSPKYKHNVL